MTKTTIPKDFCFCEKPKESVYRTDIYKTWKSMINRCYISKNRWHYGKVKVCQRWLDSFNAFKEDMGQKPTPRHSLDRIDNQKDYSPENCRWASPTEQIRNRGNTIRLSYGGDCMTLMEWSKKLGIPYGVLFQRINRGGMTFDEAVKKPYVKNRKTKKTKTGKKLNMKKAREIRALHKSGKGKAEISRIYGVTLQNICKVLENQIWKE